jgi:hypothetical protein
MGPVRIGACEVACPVMPRERNPRLKRTLDISMRHPELDVNFLIRMEPQRVGTSGSSTKSEDSELIGAIIDGVGAGSKGFVSDCRGEAGLIP